MGSTIKTILNIDGFLASCWMEGNFYGNFLSRRLWWGWCWCGKQGSAPKACHLTGRWGEKVIQICETILAILSYSNGFLDSVSWIYPPPRNSHHEDLCTYIYIFLVGNLELNLLFATGILGGLDPRNSEMFFPSWRSVRFFFWKGGQIFS